jgi:phenylpropionate dioxygenase-like ring-hydroxylating dioxygenase large terminal subunit
MLSQERNDLITRVGPGTRLNSLMRRYWQPAALVDEFEGDRPIRPVRLLGEDYVLFRDEKGEYGLLDRHCAHRGADLCYGRLEDGGLRCPFHGWLFDTSGACLEQPAEPADSLFYTRVRQPAHRCTVRSGIVFAYLGEGEPPPFPAFDCFTAPDAYTFAFKGLIDSNWMQAFEVAADPAHTSFLHRFFDDGDPDTGYGKPFRGSTMGAEMPITKIMRDFTRPDIQVETTDYGLRIATLRRISEDNVHLRITNLAFPHVFVIPLSKTMTITQWHVPIDDTHNYWYAIFTSFDQPVDKKQMRDDRLKCYSLPDYVSRANKANNYLFDPQEQKTQTYLGMGDDVNVHDQWAIESQGVIQDRTKEHLGQSDRAISAYRRILFKALDENSNDPIPMAGLDADAARALYGPPALDTIGPANGWEAFWREQDRLRRETTPWMQASTSGSTP